MDQDTISPDRVLDAASSLFDDYEDKDMRSAVTQLVAMLLLPDLDWPISQDEVAFKFTEAAILQRMNVNF